MCHDVALKDVKKIQQCIGKWCHVTRENQEEIRISGYNEEDFGAIFNDLLKMKYILLIINFSIFKLIILIT